MRHAHFIIYGTASSEIYGNDAHRIDIIIVWNLQYTLRSQMLSHIASSARPGHRLPLLDLRKCSKLRQHIGSKTTGACYLRRVRLVGSTGERLINRRFRFLPGPHLVHHIRLNIGRLVGKIVKPGMPFIKSAHRFKGYVSEG